MNALLSAPNPKRVSALPEGLFSDIANEGDVVDSLAGLGLSGQSMPKLNEVSITDDDRLFWDMDDDDMAILTKAKSISRPVSTSAAFSTSNLGHSLSPFRPESSDIHIQPHVLNGKLLDLSLMDRSSATIARTIARPSTSFLPDVDKSSFLTSSVIRPGSVPVQGSFVSHDFAAEPIFQDFLRPNANNFEVSSSGAAEADNSIEMMVVRCCISILSTAADHSLKAVELANTLRARVGTELLSTVREHYGGLLSLLERHVFVFKVDRIAKNDKVTLIGSLGGDPSSVLAGGSTAAGLMAEQLNSRSPPPRGSSQSPGLPTVSRCLHIGNVPCHLTEYQLKCEFGLYGTVENLKLVSHKNSVRRFAFVTYRTLEEAYHAKQCLGKLHPWKSAISYARKDYQTSGSSSSNNNNNNIGGWHIASSASPQLPPYAPHMDSSSSLYAPPPPPPLLYSHQPLPHPMLYPGSPPLFESVSSPPLPQGPSTPSTGTPATAAVSVAVDPILQRLCDHTYVPTQPWPVDVVKDGPYCEAIVAQLVQFGGYTTVSKLRGFLRFKVAASDNIKSVPLKALLCAYPSLFSVQNNFVSLVAAPPLNLNQQQQQQVASHIPLNDF